MLGNVQMQVRAVPLDPFAALLLSVHHAEAVEVIDADFIRRARLESGMSGSDVVAEVCEGLGINPIDLVSDCRARYLTDGRSVAGVILYARGLSLPQVAPMLGLTDHSSVIHLRRRWNEHRHCDDLLAAVFNRVALRAGVTPAIAAARGVVWAELPA